MTQKNTKQDTQDIETDEKTLSDMIVLGAVGEPSRVFFEEDVKQAVKRLKDGIAGNYSYAIHEISKQGVIDWIDKIFGEDLI